MISFQPRHIQAPELFGDFWFNSGPISIRAMKGSVVMVDFWDYSSSNCLRTLPYLKAWNRKYQDFGFLIIGVHTPEFKFGRNAENVERAIRRSGIDYPVVTDNEEFLWTSYSNRLRPTKYLIDKDGFLRYSHSGEGEYDQFERSLQSLLNEAGYRGELPELEPPLRETDIPGVVYFRATGEVQVGYLRGTIGNPEGFSPESTLDYSDHGYHVGGRFYLQGKWFNEKEFVRFDGQEGEEGYVGLQYEAVEANAIMDSEPRTKSTVFIEQDGLPLTAEIAGSDVAISSEGLSYVLVDEPRLFNLVRNKDFGEHRLKLTTASRNFGLYSFTFVTGVIHDLVSRN